MLEYYAYKVKVWEDGCFVSKQNNRKSRKTFITNTIIVFLTSSHPPISTFLFLVKVVSRDNLFFLFFITWGRESFLSSQYTWCDLSLSPAHVPMITNTLDSDIRFVFGFYTIYANYKCEAVLNLALFVSGLRNSICIVATSSQELNWRSKWCNYLTQYRYFTCCNINCYLL